MSNRKPPIGNIGDGAYLVLSVLGAGGFGITYRCMDPQDMEHNVAIKEYMPEALAERRENGWVVPREGREAAFQHGRERFSEEAEMLISLSQRIPEVVSVREILDDHNTLYYVMEYLEGLNLRQLVRVNGGKMAFGAALDATLQAGRALERVHEAGVVHRNICPESLMALPDGHLKIIDFGGAKTLSALSQKFSVAVRPGFAPPEQYAGNLAQGSFTDVYSLAATFYFLASGVILPTAPDRMSGQGYRPLLELVPECTPEVSLAVDRALVLDARHRTQAMWEFLQGIDPPPPKPIRTEQRSGRTGTGSSRSGKAAPEAWVEVLQGACAGQRFPLPPDEPVCVGRSPARCQIVLSGHPEISGVHLQMLYQPRKKGIYLIDESTNGTWCRGMRLKKGTKYHIRPGQEFGLGSMQCVITVKMGGQSG